MDEAENQINFDFEHKEEKQKLKLNKTCITTRRKKNPKK